MKFLARRLIASLIVMPLVAGLYLLLIVSLFALGIDGLSLGEAYNNAILIGVSFGVMFILYPQIAKALNI